MSNDFRDRYAVDGPVNDHVEKIAERLRTDGIIFYRGGTDRAEILALVRQLGTIFVHRDAEMDGITQLHCRMDVKDRAGYLGFSAHALPLHTDSSSERHPPNILLTQCIRPAPDGGAALFVDGQLLFHHLQCEYPDVLAAFSADASMIFGGSGRQCYPGAMFTRAPDGRVVVRFRMDQCGYFSAPLTPHFQRLCCAFDALTVEVPIGAGEGYIVQNGWWLHGRTAYRGAREVYRILAHTPHEGAAPVDIGYGFPLRAMATTAVSWPRRVAT